MGLIRLGIVSTAHINRLVIPGAQASEKVELIAVASREQSARGGVRARVGDRARLRLLRGAARGPGRRRRLHLAAEHACTASGRSERSRRASTSSARSRFSRHPADVEQAFDAAERSRAPPDGGVHVPAQPADEAARRARPRGRDRRAAGRPLRLQLLPLRRGEHPPAHRRRGRQPDGRRLLLRQRIAAARRRARERVRPGVRRAERDRLGLHGRDALPRRRLRAVRLRDVRSPSATSSRRSAPRARSSSTIRGTAASR